MSGTVKIFNSIATDMALTLGGPTQIHVPGSAGPPEWWPGTAATRVPRSDTGLADDGKFGWETNLTLRPTSGQGASANFTVNIPENLQTSNELELYLFYNEDPSKGIWVLLWQGEIQQNGTTDS